MAELARTAAEEAGAARPRVALRSGRSRGIAVLAGTWTCGALVGALAMFLLIGGGAPQGERPTQTVHHEVQLPAPEAVEEDAAAVAEEEGQPAGQLEREEPPPRPSSPRRAAERNAALWAMGLDPLGGHERRWPEDFALRAGMHLGRSPSESAGPSPLRADAGLGRRGEEVPAPAAGPPMLPHDPLPQAAVARERLLEELLREMSGWTL